MRFKIRINENEVKEALGAIVDAQGPITTKKMAMSLIIVATENLIRSSGGNRTGLSRKRGVGQYAHNATGKTIRSFKAVPNGKGWEVILGGAAYELENGRGPHTVPIGVLRAWAAAKFPGIVGSDLDRFLKNLQQRIRNNGLRPTRFFTRAIQEFNNTLKKYQYIQQLPSEAQLQAYADSLRNKVETAALPRVSRRSE